MQHVVAGLPDRDIELVVGTDRDELPAVGFVLGQVVVDHRRLRRIVEHVLHMLDLGNLRQLGDVERAVVEGDAVRPVEARRQHLDLAFAVLVDDGIDLVDQAAADEHRALVAERERTGIRHAGGIDLDVEAGRGLEFCDRQLVRRRSVAAAARPAPAWRPLHCPDARSWANPAASGGAAAGAAAAGGLAGCCAVAANVNAPKKTPASNTLRGDA